MDGRHVEDRRHLALVFAMAHKRTVAAPAKGQRQSVEHDGFARPGFTGQDRKAFLQSEVQPLDENDIADRKMNEHGLTGRRTKPE